MHVLLASNDQIRLGFLLCLLRDAGIEAMLLDTYASAMDGSIGAVPRRLAVATQDATRARRVLTEAGELSASA